MTALAAEAAERIRALPGVVAAGATNMMPLDRTLDIVGFPAPWTPPGSARATARALQYLDHAGICGSTGASLPRRPGIYPRRHDERDTVLDRQRNIRAPVSTAAPGRISVSMEFEGPEIHSRDTGSGRRRSEGRQRREAAARNVHARSRQRAVLGSLRDCSANRRQPCLAGADRYAAPFRRWRQRPRSR